MDASIEPESKADAILARLAQILQEVDMDITSLRQITNKLAEEFGKEVHEYKALIKVVDLTAFVPNNVSKSTSIIS